MDQKQGSLPSNRKTNQPLIDLWLWHTSMVDMWLLPEPRLANVVMIQSHMQNHIHSFCTEIRPWLRPAQKIKQVIQMNTAGYCSSDGYIIFTYIYLHIFTMDDIFYGRLLTALSGWQQNKPHPTSWCLLLKLQLAVSLTMLETAFNKKTDTNSFFPLGGFFAQSSWCCRSSQKLQYKLPNELPVNNWTKSLPQLEQDQWQLPPPGTCACMHACVVFTYNIVYTHLDRASWTKTNQ